MASKRQGFRNIPFKSIFQKKYFREFAYLLIFFLLIDLSILAIIKIQKKGYQQVSVNEQNTDQSVISAGESENSRWSLYKNARFGYEISYPSDWFVSPISYTIYIDENNEIPFDLDQAVLIYSQKVTSNVALTSQLPDNSLYLEVKAIPIDYTFSDWWNDHEEFFKYSFEFLNTTVAINEDQINSNIIQFYESDKQGELVGQAIFQWKKNHLYIMYIKSSSGINNHPYLRRIADSIKLTPTGELVSWRKQIHPSGFSLDLPNIALMIDSRIALWEIRSAMRGELTSCGCGLLMYINIYDNPRQLTVPEWWQEEYEQLDEHSQAHAGKEIVPVILRNRQFYKKTGFGGDSNSITYYIPVKEKIYSLSYSDFPVPNDPDNNWKVKIYERIIGSFQADELNAF